MPCCLSCRARDTQSGAMQYWYPRSRRPCDTGEAQYMQFIAFLSYSQIESERYIGCSTWMPPLIAEPTYTLEHLCIFHQLPVYHNDVALWGLVLDIAIPTRLIAIIIDSLTCGDRLLTVTTHRDYALIAWISKKLALSWQLPQPHESRSALTTS